MRVETKWSKKIANLRCDNGTEYTNRKFQGWCRTKKTSEKEEDKQKRVQVADVEGQEEDDSGEENEQETEDKEEQEETEEEHIKLEQKEDSEQKKDSEQEEKTEREVKTRLETPRRTPKQRRSPKRFPDYAMLTYEEAVNGRDKKRWKKAIEEEKSSLKKIKPGNWSTARMSRIEKS